MLNVSSIVLFLFSCIRHSDLSYYFGESVISFRSLSKKLRSTKSYQRKGNCRHSVINKGPMPSCNECNIKLAENSIRFLKWPHQKKYLKQEQTSTSCSSSYQWRDFIAWLKKSSIIPSRYLEETTTSITLVRRHKCERLRVLSTWNSHECIRQIMLMRKLVKYTRDKGSIGYVERMKLSYEGGGKCGGQTLALILLVQMACFCAVHPTRKLNYSCFHLENH